MKPINKFFKLGNKIKINKIILFCIFGILLLVIGFYFGKNQKLRKTYVGDNYQPDHVSQEITPTVNPITSEKNLEKINELLTECKNKADEYWNSYLNEQEKIDKACEREVNKENAFEGAFTCESTRNIYQESIDSYLEAYGKEILFCRKIIAEYSGDIEEVKNINNEINNNLILDKIDKLIKEIKDLKDY